MSNCPVGIVIACHNPLRRVDRAVASVIDGPATATVVCHNTDLGPVRDKVFRAIPVSERGRVRFLTLDDGIPSPTGPFMLGLQRATAPWVGILGSDDYLQPGAIQAMLRLSADRDAVVPHLLRGTATVPTPPVRPLPRAHRDALRDRLFYRSAPLGLLRREFLLEGDISLVPGLTNGGDLLFSARVWTEGRIAVQRGGPGYVIGEDAPDRVTMRLAPAEEELAHVESVWDSEWLAAQTAELRRALGIKYLRIHVFGFAYYRARAGRWTDEDRIRLRDRTLQILRLAPGCAEPLSVADRRLLDAICDPAATADELIERALARRRFGSPATLRTRKIRYLLHREAPLRFMAASLCAQGVPR